MIHHEGTKGTKDTKLGRELWLRGLRVQRQVAIPVSYKGAELGTVVRIDLLVECAVVVEVKACEKLTDIHRAQLLTYLELSAHKVGLLINFNVELLRHGMRRILNG